jgi:hypothetical protein
MTTNSFWTTGDVTNSRTVRLVGGAPPGSPFTFDNTAFSASLISQTINLNAVEKWTITNSSIFSHAFHIHDIQFNLVSRLGGSGVVTNIQSYEQGWKDTVYVQQNSSVTFITKFDNFASSYNPFMYHCHMVNHEDEGTMAQFLVVNNTVENLVIASFTRTGTNSQIALKFNATPGTTYTLQYSGSVESPSWGDISSVTSDGSAVTYTETNALRLAASRGFYRVVMPVIPDPVGTSFAASIAKVTTTSQTSTNDPICTTTPK